MIKLEIIEDAIRQRLAFLRDLADLIDTKPANDNADRHDVEHALILREATSDSSK